MSFVQLMEYTTSDPEQVKRVTEDWEKATRGKRSAHRVLMLKHHAQPDRYCDMVFFDSYEEAMANSKLPETQEFADRQRQLVDGEISYIDLDVVEDKEL